MEEEEKYGKYISDDEQNAYRDVVKQMMNEKTTTAYVYNKNIIEKLEKNIPNLQITKKEFYWEVRRKDKDKKVLTVRETCKIFSISRPTLDNWIKLGCPYHAIGGRKYFSQDEIEEWIKSK